MAIEEEPKPTDQHRFLSLIRNSTVWKDLTNILLLVFLYMLQGIPLGLSSVVPLLLQSNTKTASYRDVGIFSWVGWTFSLKLTWAPFVDTFYFKRIGRRKSWLIPVQFAIGGVCFIIGGYIDRWFGRPEGDPWGPLGTTGDVQIFALTAAFFGLNFLAATQDIAVDGWAISMLSKENLGWAPTCQTIGQTIGLLAGFTLFMVFESPDMCNDYFRSTPIPGKGFISFSGFLYACGVLFISSTTLIGLFKREIENSTQETSPQVIDGTANEINKTGEVSLVPAGLEELELRSNKENEVAEQKEENQTTISKWIYFTQAYLLMLRMLMLKPVLIYVAFIFSQKFIFLASDSVSGLKLIENGLSKETMALISSFMMPYEIILPLLVVRWSSGPRPISTMLKSSIPLFFLSFTSIPLVYYVDYFKTVTPINATTIVGNSNSISNDSKVSMSPYIYVILALQSSISSVFGTIIHLSQGTFHARIADPSLGGTYMTLLNTLVNLSVSLPSTVLLFFIDPLTWRTCENASLEKVITFLNSSSTNRTKLVQHAEDFLSNNVTCMDFEGRESCKLAGGLCRTIVDGYYLLSGVGFVCGILAYYFLHKMARYLDSRTVEAYRVKEQSESPETPETPGVASTDV